MEKRYNAYSEFLKQKFGAKVYKITLDAGFSCPNRDGTISNSGCIFCDDGGSFSQAHSNRLSIDEQVRVGAETLKNRFKAQKFMSYFQAFSNTYKKKFIQHLLIILMLLEFLLGLVLIASMTIS